MNHLIELLGAVLLGVPWLAGIVLAKGLWSTIAAVCVPPFAWYLVAELSVSIIGWLGA